MSEPTETEQIIELTVPPGQHERIRLDVYITSFVENATRSKVQAAIREGRVTVNGAVAKSAYVVQPGDVVRCRVRKPPPIELRPQEIPIEILYEDQWLIVVNKPAGMVVHPAYGHRDGTLVNALLHHVGATDLSEAHGLSTVSSGPRYEGDPTRRPGLVHRLDKDTSGVMVIARDDVVHANLSRQFSRRTIERVYVALLVGHPDPVEGTIDTWIARDIRDRKKMAVSVESSGKHAVTTYCVREWLVGTALVEFRLKTGRTHQIRVHARHIGHPVFGDPVYGGRARPPSMLDARQRTTFSAALAAIDRQALHAQVLGFRHPSTGKPMRFEATVPADMETAITLFRRTADRP